LNDSPYDPAVYTVGTKLDKEILTTLKDFVEPTLMKKTLPIFLYDMFSSWIQIGMALINSLVCNKKNLKLKWQQDERLDRAMEQIEKDLDVI